MPGTLTIWATLKTAIPSWACRWRLRWQTSCLFRWMNFCATAWSTPRKFSPMRFKCFWRIATTTRYAYLPIYSKQPKTRSAGIWSWNNRNSADGHSWLCCATLFLQCKAPGAGAVCLCVRRFVSYACPIGKFGSSSSSFIIKCCFISSLTASSSIMGV